MENKTTCTCASIVTWDASLTDWDALQKLATKWLNDLNVTSSPRTWKSIEMLYLARYSAGTSIFTTKWLTTGTSYVLSHLAAHTRHDAEMRQYLLKTLVPRSPENSKWHQVETIIPAVLLLLLDVKHV